MGFGGSSLSGWFWRAAWIQLQLQLQVPLPGGQGGEWIEGVVVESDPQCHGLSLR